jgi:hypothetical protein
MQEQEQDLTAGRSAERVAFNDDIFRKANEKIRDRAERLGTDDFERLPIICECAEESCSEVLQVGAGEYERIRADPRLFFNAPGHDAAAQGWGEVVERHEGYVVFEKQGRAGEIAEMLDDGTTV